MTVTCHACDETVKLPGKGTARALFMAYKSGEKRVILDSKHRQEGFAEVFDVAGQTFFVCPFCSVVSGLDSVDSDWLREQWPKSP